MLVFKTATSLVEPVDLPSDFFSVLASGLVSPFGSAAEAATNPNTKLNAQSGVSNLIRWGIFHGRLPKSRSELSSLVLGRTSVFVQALPRAWAMPYKLLEPAPAPGAGPS